MNVRKWKIDLVFLVFLSSLTQLAAQMNHENTVDSTQALAARLVTLGYGGLFESGSNDIPDEIWESEENRKLLMAMIVGDDFSSEAIFLANEIMRRQDLRWIQPRSVRVAFAYAHALSNWNNNPYETGANLWGFLYHGESPGRLGQVFLDLGQTSTQALIDLLEEERVLLYEGSQEATLGNSFSYRVKDFAAYYLSRIMQIPIVFHQQNDARDREILALKTKLYAH
jgi:hypothetical protein